jgi:hypothetical protein
MATQSKGYLIGLVLLQLALSQQARAQDVLSDHKQRGLKRLTSIGLVIRPNVQLEILTVKEWGDLIEVRLHRDIPELKFEEPSDSRAWLELSVLTSDQGCVFELSVYRWVKVLDSGEEIFAKVWWGSREVLGTVERKIAIETLEPVIRSLAADYIRAQR